MNQRSGLECRVNFNIDHGDRVVQNHGVESVKGVWRKVVQTHGYIGDGGSHVQEAFGRQLKTGGLTYPGNYPDRVKPKVWAELEPEGRKVVGWKCRRSNGFFY